MVASGIEAQIADALFNHIASLVTEPETAVAWENVDLDGAGQHLQISLVTAETEQVSFGGAGFNRHSGFLQVSVYVAEGTGSITAREIARQVMAHCKRGTTIVRHGRSVRINRPPFASGPLREPGWLQIPVTVPWQCDTPNPA